MNRRGLTLVEVSIVITIMAILAMIALPSMKLTVKRGDELELKRVLRNTREAIDRYYKQQEEINGGGIEALNYPKNFEAMIEAKVLRTIPVDPIAGKAEWRFISSTDDILSKETNGDNLWDLRSLSEDTAINETLYSSW